MDIIKSRAANLTPHFKSLGVGTLLGHFVTETISIGQYYSGAASVGDGIHQYDSEGYLNSLGSFHSAIELHPQIRASSRRVPLFR
jgi:hypothetical protein